MSSSERKLSLDVLENVFLKNGRLSEAFDAAVPESSDDRDRRFIRALTSGVTERKVLLDAVLSRRSSVKLKKMRPVLRLVLNMGIYEILYMKTEDYAAVNEYVKLACSRGLAGLKGFVNGVLRGCIKDRDTLTDGLEIWERISLPEDLWQRFVLWYGSDTAEKIGEAFLSEKEGLTVRRIGTRISEDDFIKGLKDAGAEAVKSDVLPDAWMITRVGEIFRSELYDRGGFYVQDINSQLIPYLVRDLFADEKLKVLDVCGSPGGKSIILADDHPGKASILCCDLTEKKTAVIRENIERLGLEGIQVKVRDASVRDDLTRKSYDLLIADVPCSCLGTIGKRPEIKLRVSEESLKENAALQKKILSAAADQVKPGGTLLYSTCTVNPEENTENAVWFTENHPDFETVSLTEYAPDVLRDAVTDGFLQTIPGRDAGDGFFAARFRRKLS